MNEIEKYVELSFIKGIGNRTLKALFEIYKTPEEVFNESFDKLSKKIGNKNAEKILYRDKKLKELAKKEVDKAEKIGAEIIPITDKKYPELLKELPDPPFILYSLGNIETVKNSLSIVGSRKYSSYGKSTTEKFSKELAEAGVNIVSGLASGIDSIAHKAVIKSGGTTTAVLGNGIDIVFPPENKKLFQEIVENGVVLSEYPIGTKPSKYTFPIRNRIIAGLSYGVIVTEASRKSGALITAKLASDYGRVVFSVPANINNPLAEGNNQLLKEGAFPLTDIKDIKNIFPYLFKDRKNEKSIELDELEKQILRMLSEPKHIDDIVEKTKISIDKLSVILFDMEMKGVITCVNGLYIKN